MTQKYGRFVRLNSSNRELLEMALDEQLQHEPVMRSMGCDIEAISGTLVEPNRTEALLSEGRVMAAAGVFQHWPGRGEAWMFVSRFATARHLTLVTRRCAVMLDQLQTDPLWRRIEMNVLAASLWRESFTRALGFEPEGYLKRWDPAGRDFVHYARVRWTQ